MKPSEFVLLYFSDLCLSERKLEKVLIEHAHEQDWNKIYQLLKYHKLHIFFYNDYKEYIPAQINCHFYNAVEFTKYWHHVLLEEAKQIDSVFQDEQIDYILLKNFGFSNFIYKNPMYRPSNDLDILIPKSKLSIAQETIESLGYRCYYKKPDFNFGLLPKGIRVKHVGYHECQYKKILDNRALNVELHLDCSSIGPTIISSFAESRDRLKIGTYICPIMDALHSYLYICANAYENFETNCGVYFNTYLRDLLDVVLGYKHNAEFLTPQLLVNISKKYNLYYKLCYVYHYIEKLVPNALPAELTTLFTLMPLDKIQNHLYDFGASVNWISPEKDRLFNAEERKHEYSQAYIEHCFSEQNPNYKFPLKARHPTYLTYLFEIVNRSICWSFEIKDNTLCFKIKNPDLTTENGTFGITFSTMVDATTAYQLLGNPMTNIDIEKKGNCYQAYVSSQGSYYESVVDESTMTVNFYFPLSIFFQKNGKIAYNILLYKRIYEDCVEWCGGVYEDYNPKGCLGIIEI